MNIETELAVDPIELKEVLSKAPGLKVLDEPKSSTYPTAVQCADTDEVFVGRIRRDETVENGVNIWVVADNLRKGAALNTVQIAEVLVKEYL